MANKKLCILMQLFFVKTYKSQMFNHIVYVLPLFPQLGIVASEELGTAMNANADRFLQVRHSVVLSCTWTHGMDCHTDTWTLHRLKRASFSSLATFFIYNLAELTVTLQTLP